MGAGFADINSEVQSCNIAGLRSFEGGLDVRKELDAAVAASTFAVSRATLRSEQVRSWVAACGSRREWIMAKVPSRELKALVEALSEPLGAFTSSDTGTIGFALHDFMPGVVQDVTVDLFATDLVRTAALLGSGHTLSVVAGWMRGEPAEYSHVRVLRGVSVSEPVAFGEGVRFEKLSGEGREVAEYADFGLVPAFDLMGQPAMRTTMRVGAMFYRPEGSERDQLGRRGARQPDIVGPEVATGERFADLLNALSLACSSCVQVAYEWNDYSDEMLLMRGGGARSGPTMYNVPRFRVREIAAGGSEITPARLAEANSILSRMSGRRDLDIAIARWKNSMIALDEANRIIDLRTVLESLYCEGARNELKLRTTLRGALHLAPTPADRRDYYAKLRALYDLGSKVVHGGRLSNRNDVKSLVAWSYLELRRAILKRLEEGPTMDWDALMLGLPQPLVE